MNFSHFCILIIFFACTRSADAQNRIKVTGYDFESPVNVKDWWVHNKNIYLSQCEQKDCDQPAGSEKCLRIEWKVPENMPFSWFTDIKIDTFGNQAMGNTWNSFKENTWLSLKANTAGADSVYFQFIVFTKDEKDKWGSKETIGFKSEAWETLKVKLSNLHFDNWGKGDLAQPDFSSIIPARIEIGIRSEKKNNSGNIDLRLDDILLTNYEP